MKELSILGKLPARSTRKRQMAPTKVSPRRGPPKKATNIPPKAPRTQFKCTSTDDFVRTMIIHKRQSNNHKVNLIECHKKHTHTDLSPDNSNHVKAFKRRHDHLMNHREDEV